MTQANFLVLVFFAISSFSYAQDTLWTVIEDSVYKVSYPSERWTEEDPIATTMKFMIFTDLESTEDVFRENINLNLEILPHKDVGLEAYAKSGREMISQYFNDFKSERFEKATASGQDYFEHVFIATQGVYKLRFCQRSFVKEENAYVLTFVAESSKYENYYREASLIMDSFVLKN